MKIKHLPFFVPLFLKKNGFNIVLFLLATVYTSCIESDLCDCSKTGNLSEQTDSVIHEFGHESNSTFNAQVDAEIRKIITLGIKIGTDYKEFDKEVQTTTNKIMDIYPDLTSFQRFEKDFYCQFVANICHKKDWSREKIEQMKIEESQRIHKLLEDIFLARINRQDSLSQIKTQSTGASPLNSNSLIATQKESVKPQSKSKKKTTSDADVENIFLSGEISDYQKNDKIDILLDGKSIGQVNNDGSFDLKFQSPLNANIKIKFSSQKGCTEYIDILVNESTLSNKLVKLSCK